MHFRLCEYSRVEKWGKSPALVEPARQSRVPGGGERTKQAKTCAVGHVVVSVRMKL